MGEQFKWNPSTDRISEMLQQAVYMEDHVTLEHLLKQRANLEAKDETGTTPLHIAATHNKLTALSWLLKCSADPTATDSEGFDALSWACMKGHQQVVARLLDCNVNFEEVVSSNGKTPLALCAERGHLDCVKDLLVSRAHLEQTNKDGSTALMSAAHHAETEVVAHLLCLQARVNKTDNEGWTALMCAMNAPVPPASAGGEQAEKKVNIDGVVGRKSTSELLMLHGADVNAQTADGITALLIAAGQNRPAAVKRLLEGRAQVNLSSARGQTALLMAASNDLPDTARALILARADVNQANEKKHSPLSLAEKYGHREVMDLLKQAGATDPKGKKPKKGAKKK